MQAIGTWKPEFETTVKMLAETLQDYEKSRREFRKSGGQHIVAYTNKSGATNYVKNPYVTIIHEQRKSILMFCRELGLTSAGLRKIDEKAMKGGKKKSRADALREGKPKHGAS